MSCAAVFDPQRSMNSFQPAGRQSPRSDEFLVGTGQGTDWRKFTRFALSSKQCGSVAFAAGVLKCRAARLGLSRSEETGWSEWLAVRTKNPEPKMAAVRIARRFTVGTSSRL